MLGLSAMAALGWIATFERAPEAGAAGTPMTSRTPPPGKNRLAYESSPYLLQHAENPVDWYPWGEEAFAKARAENKPIFLSVGYSTCYWCHVMERETFADPETAKLMNATVISIKVDREERPDVDEIYMTAVQLMTGRGGWPMSVLLTPELKPFFGATYIPRPQFRDLLQRLDRAWIEQREQINAGADELTAALKRHADPSSATAAASLPGPGLLREAAAGYAREFDAKHGGFGPAPKFPKPPHLQALLADYEANGEKHSLRMITVTLDAMARGGIHDQIGGGFHRYSTDARWRVPHFEKMLYDNAQLLHTYARAYQLTGNADLRRVAEAIVSYVAREMTAPNGLFYSAQDAEVEHEEGRSYVWTRGEIQALLSKEEFALAEQVYGLEAQPDFDGRYILHWPRAYAETARALKLKPEELFARLAPIQSKLLAARDQRPQPLTDDKAITAWNGLMIEALAFAGQALKHPEYLRMAERAADALLRIHRDADGKLLHVSRGGNARLPAYLEDYAALILGLQALEKSAAAPRWRDTAVALADTMIARLWDATRGGFYHAPEDVQHLLVRNKDAYDGAMPSGNSLAARALTGLAASGEKRYAAYAAGTLRAFAPVLERTPMATPYLLETLRVYHARQLPTDATLPQGAGALRDSAALVQLTTTLDQAEFSAKQRLKVLLKIEPGWHVNANPASLEFLIPTTVSASLGGRALSVQASYPAGEVITTPVGEWRVYEGLVDIPLTLQAAEVASGGKLDVTVRVQACDDQGQCLPPAVLHTELQLPARGEGAR